jgi:hypothetical protein
MENREVKQAREEAASAIKLAHQMTEIVGWLVADMRAAQVLRPHTATHILQLLTADDHSVHRSSHSKARLRDRLLGQTVPEKELKRDAEWRPKP